MPQTALMNPEAPMYIPEASKSIMGAMMTDAWKYQVKAKEHGTVGTGHALCRTWLGEVVRIE